jgi:hypothetical protein
MPPPRPSAFGASFPEEDVKNVYLSKETTAYDPSAESRVASKRKREEEAEVVCQTGVRISVTFPNLGLLDGSFAYSTFC